MTKYIAWGASKLLHIHLLEAENSPFAYCIDSNPAKTMIHNLPVVRPAALAEEAPDSFHIVIFAVSNGALRAISSLLSRQGLTYRKDYSFYADFLHPEYERAFEAALGRKPDPALKDFAISFNLNSTKPMQTTIMGTELFLECFVESAGLPGAVAEVGAYEGGNALCALTYAHARGMAPRPYLVFDSFEGFPSLSQYDPQGFAQGDLRTETSYEEINNHFLVYDEATVIKGFVPGTFARVSPAERFSLVFYDCDLYQPMIDTLAFFWERMTPGGLLLIHDYVVEPGGFEGVRQGVEHFFGTTPAELALFPQNTMALLRKPRS